MNILKTIAAVSAIALSSFSVNAEQLSVGGITWDSSYVNPSNVTLHNDFFASGEYYQNIDSGVLSGGGIVSAVNGQDSSIFCVVAGCSLEYSFDGFTVGAGNAVDNSVATLDFTVTEANGDTNLFLSLVADGYTSYTAHDAEHTSFTAFFSVLEIAGTAWKNFDTNTLRNDTDFGMVGTQDTTEFGSEPLHTAIFKSNSVPAPTTLAIFGLGLLGLARLRKAK